MLKIVTAPDSVLFKQVKLVSKVDDRILQLITEMKKTLLAAKDPEGVGLAAPQVGKSLSIFIAKPTQKSPIQVFINPKMLKKSDEKGNLPPISSSKKTKSTPVKLEGCLSLVDIWGEVKRNSSITISYLDEKGNSHTKTFRGFMATIIQHEMDHLNGILFPKKVLEQKGKLYKSKKDNKGEYIFEEVEI